MTGRTTRTSVTFSRPFSLSDLDGIQPAGTYRIQTLDVTLDSLSFLAYRRVSTTIELPCVGVAGSRRHADRCGTDRARSSASPDPRSSFGQILPDIPHTMGPRLRPDGSPPRASLERVNLDEKGLSSDCRRSYPDLAFRQEGHATR